MPIGVFLVGKYRGMHSFTMFMNIHQASCSSERYQLCRIPVYLATLAGSYWLINDLNYQQSTTFIYQNAAKWSFSTLYIIL